MPLTIGLLALLLAVPVAQQPKSTAAAKGGGTADYAGIEKLSTAFTDAINRGDFKGAAATYDADGVYVGIDGQKHAGLADIEESFSHLTGIKLTLQVGNVHLIRPDTAVVQGTWRVAGADVQPPDHGEYMAVVKKAGTGWKFAEVRPWVPAPM